MLRLLGGLDCIDPFGCFRRFRRLPLVYFPLPLVHLFFRFSHALKLFLPLSELPLTLLCHKLPLSNRRHRPNDDDRSLAPRILVLRSLKKIPRASSCRLWGRRPKPDLRENLVYGSLLLLSRVGFHKGYERLCDSEPADTGLFSGSLPVNLLDPRASKYVKASKERGQPE
jgi:hypothetical protein